LANISTYTRINRKLEAKYSVRVLRSLNKIKDQIIGWVKAFGATEAANKINGALIINGIAPDIKELYQQTGLIHARQTYAELMNSTRAARLRLMKGSPDYLSAKSVIYYERKAPVGLGFSETWTSNINSILQQFLTDKILFRTSETTKKLLYEIISRGIAQGKGINEIVKDLEQTDVLVNQSERIVRTEVNRSANLGIIEGGKSFPFEQFKEWISIKDLRTRGTYVEDHADHYRMHGQRVDFDSAFIDPQNNEPLNQPGDPAAHPADTINCRCTMRLIAKRDERGRLIPKRKGGGVVVIQNFNRSQQTITI
jgi:hypothetical protein